MRPRLLLLSFFLLPALAAAQQAGQKPAAPPAKTQFVFHSNTRLVVEAVTVNDKDGKPISGLTAKDFQITEDNVPQSISVCEYQQLNDASPPPPPPASIAAPTTTYTIAPETPGNTRYTDRRLVVLYFDMTAMPTPDQLRALDAAQSFIAKQLRPADLVAVMTYEGAGVKVKQDFTSNRDLIEEALSKIVVAIGAGFDEADADAAASDTGSAFGQDDSEFNVFNTNRQLAALQTAVNMLAPLSEKKSLVYFASGLNLNGVDNQAQLQATTNAAIRANVALYPLDARGLVASAPMGDATQGSSGGSAMYTGQAAKAYQDRLIRSQDTLYALGSDTGGKAIFDTNDLSRGIATARDAIGSYYILGYYTTNATLDGKYRRVKVSVVGHADAKLAYRTGYYTGKVFAKFTEADKERQLEDALMLGDPITDLTIDLEVNYFQLNSAEYFVPIAAKIPGRELALAKRGGAERSQIDFIGEIKDQYGTTITNLRDKVDMKLTGATAQQLARVPIEYNTGFTVLPGKYTIKLLARDAETGRIGTFIKDFTIPNLVKVTDRLPISSVVLASQQVALTAALYNAKKDTSKDAAQAANPLVENGRELMPSVTRVFRQNGQMLVYLQAYEHGAATMAPLDAFVTFYRADAKTGLTKAMETPLQNLNTGIAGRAGAIPIHFDLPLSGLAPGKYTVQVTVLEPGTQHANYWRGEIEIVP